MDTPLDAHQLEGQLEDKEAMGSTLEALVGEGIVDVLT